MSKRYIKPHYTFFEKCVLALNGIRYGIYSELHLKIHLLFSMIAIAMGVYFKITRLEWSILIISIGIVLITEVLNTSIELSIDLQTKSKHIRAKLSKDLAAGAVLIASIQALLVGYLLFYHKLVMLLAIKHI